MQEVIGNLLPLAMAIALGPIPIIAIALMLKTPEPGRTSAGFAVGWVAGMAVLAVVLTALAAQVPEGDAEHPRHWIAVVQLVLGLLLILLAAKKIATRPAGDAEAEMPAFLGKLAQTPPGRSPLVGFAAAAVNPKHVAFVLPIGTLVVDYGLSRGQVGTALGIFTLLASVTVIAPAIAWWIAPERVGRIVDTAFTWMVRNMNVVSAGVLLLIGVNVIGKGIANF
ncbi:MAG: GAP family protein [Thermomicrobiales bacterium]